MEIKLFHVYFALIECEIRMLGSVFVRVFVIKGKHKMKMACFESAVDHNLEATLNRVQNLRKERK